MKETLSSLQRVQAVLDGTRPDRLPVLPLTCIWVGQQAGLTMDEMYGDAARMARAHVEAWRRFGYDGCVISFDTAVLAEACGAKVIRRPDAQIVVDEGAPLLKDLRDVEQLEVPDPHRAGRLPYWLDVTRRVADAVGDEAFVMGCADQMPFSLACALRGTQTFMMDLLTEDPEAIARVIDYGRRVHIRFATAYREAGARAITTGDAPAGPSMIAPEQYRRFAWAAEKACVEAEQAAGIAVSLHICGNTNPILADMVACGSRLIEVDWMVDLARLRALADATGAVILGNVNPADPLAFGTPAAVEAAVAEAIGQTRGRGFIIGSGCLVSRNTPAANIAALVTAARTHGAGERLAALAHKEVPS